MKESTYEAIISSRITEAKKLANDCLLFIIQNIDNPSDEDIQDIKLVLCELLYNAVIHGNNQDERKNVCISAKITHNILFVKICDEGEGFDYENIISGENAVNSDEILKENGRGIRLVISLVDKFSFNSAGNIIEFIKKVGSDG